MQSNEEFGPFVLLQKIAEGGMAVTYLARVKGDPVGKELVVKRILPRLADDEELRRLFVEEARTAAQLDHDNIVRTYDYGDVDGEYYLAMEYIWGEDLRRIAERGVAIGKFISLRFAVDVVARAARGLYNAHNQLDEDANPIGLVHRDVSPPNIMVGFDGAVKVVDFGIAKAESHYMSVRPGQLKGKFGYMSPEQVQGLEVDHRSDIFALGTVLYELTTKRRLFKAESDVGTIKLVSEAKFDPPHRVRADYPPRLAEIVEKALARDPRDRYASADEMANALELFLKETRTEPTPAQIGGYLKEIFPDKLDELNEITGTDYAGPTGRPSIKERPKVVPKPKPRQALLPDFDEVEVEEASRAPEPVDYIPFDEASFDASKKTSRVVLGLFGIICAALLGYGVYIVATTGLRPTGIDRYVTDQPDVDLELVPYERPDPPPVVTYAVRSEPAGAWIIVNGIATRTQTPNDVSLVRDSLNTVMVVRDGYATVVRNVEVGTSGDSLDFELTPFTMPEGWEPPEPAEDEEPITEWTHPVGRIHVDTTSPGGPLPGAEVLRNGELVEGTTPLTIEVPSGTPQHITTRMTGYRDAVTVVHARPLADESDTRFVTLEMPPSRETGNIYTTLRITTTPRDATVLWNGDDIGTARHANLPTPLHHIISVEMEEHEPMVRAFDARVGAIDFLAVLSPIRRDPAQLTLSVEPEGTQIYAQLMRAGSPGASSLGRTNVDARQMEAGLYEVTFNFQGPEDRMRARVELELLAGHHHSWTYILDGDQLELVESDVVELPPSEP